MFTWKILEVFAKNDVITHVKYFVSADQVETEGYWYFDNPIVEIPFADVTEEIIIEWVKADAQKDGKCHIITNLEAQLEQLKIKPIPAPWQPQIFKPEI
jgi:hypothetical protein